jgi:hypothetical protein
MGFWNEVMHSFLRRSRGFRENCVEPLHYTLPLIDNTRNKQKITAAVRLGPLALRMPFPTVSCLRGLHSATTVPGLV